MLKSGRSQLRTQEGLSQISTVFQKGRSMTDILALGFDLIISLGSVPAKLLLRKDMGQRTVSPFGLVGSIIFQGYFGFFTTIISGLLLWSLVNPKIEPEIPNYLYFFYFIPLLAYLLYILQQGINFYRKNISTSGASSAKYSFDRGNSKYFQYLIGTKWNNIIVTDKNLLIYVEPLESLKYSASTLIILAILYCVLCNFFPESTIALFFIILLAGVMTVASAMVFSSLCLLIEELSIQWRIRGAALDMIDSEYDLELLEAEKIKLLSKYNSKVDSSIDTCATVLLPEQYLIDPFINYKENLFFDEKIKLLSFSEFTEHLRTHFLGSFKKALEYQTQEVIYFAERVSIEVKNKDGTIIWQSAFNNDDPNVKRKREVETELNQYTLLVEVLSHIWDRFELAKTSISNIVVYNSFNNRIHDTKKLHSVGMYCIFPKALHSKTHNQLDSNKAIFEYLYSYREQSYMYFNHKVTTILDKTIMLFIERLLLEIIIFFDHYTSNLFKSKSNDKISTRIDLIHKFSKEINLSEQAIIDQFSELILQLAENDVTFSTNFLDLPASEFIASSPIAKKYAELLRYWKYVD